MRMPLTVEYTNGSTEEVEAVFADFIGFERVWGRTMMKFSDEMRFTDLAWLAWSALTHRGLTRLKFDPDWIATVEMVTSIDKNAPPIDESAPPVESMVSNTESATLIDDGAVVGEIPLSQATEVNTG